jgi:hypothetical protein
LGSEFYAKQQADLAKAMNWPAQIISALPHCIYPPCATSPVDTGNPTPCPDQVQQTCIQTIKYDAGGHTYSLTGANMLAQCILSNKETGTATADVTKTGASLGFFEKIQQTIKQYYAEYNDPNTTTSRQRALLITAVGIVFVLLLFLSGDSGGDEE